MGNNEPATTSYPLDSSKLIRLGNRGFTLGGPLTTCDRCRDLFVHDRDDDLLGSLLDHEVERWASLGEPGSADDRDWFRRETASEIQAFHNAAGEPSAIPD